MNKNISTFIKYAIVYIGGFATNFSGVLDNITKLPNSYHEFKRVYLYDESFLNGNWSTDASDLIDGGNGGLDIKQPDTVMQLSVRENGEVEGGILNEKLCDADPFTWIINIKSDSPQIVNLILKRHFYVINLHEMKMEKIIDLKLVSEDKDNDTIRFETIDDITGSFPKFITLGKNLPDFKEEEKRLSDYCAGSLSRFARSYKSQQSK